MTKKELHQIVDSLEPLCQKSCKRLWDHPEVGGEEKESANYFREILSEEGFVIVNEAELPHAFYAEYGSGTPVIAILGEYDALPGLSQTVSAQKEAVQENQEGTIRFYGCPEEELLSGKVKMSYHHMFDGCDMAISWHPMSANMVYDSGYLASASAHFKFYGKSSHAAFAPEVGRSALDAVELMNVGVNYLREHVKKSGRGSLPYDRNINGNENRLWML